jgi:hypothetical protein
MGITAFRSKQHEKQKTKQEGETSTRRRGHGWPRLRTDRLPGGVQGLVQDPVWACDLTEELTNYLHGHPVK